MASLVHMIVIVLQLAILARVLLSWFPNASTENPLVAVILRITEPILAPLRRVVPRLGMLDLTPMIAIILIAAIGKLADFLPA